MIYTLDELKNVVRRVVDAYATYDSDCSRYELNAESLPPDVRLNLSSALFKFDDDWLYDSTGANNQAITYETKQHLINWLDDVYSVSNQKSYLDSLEKSIDEYTRRELQRLIDDECGVKTRCRGWDE